MNSSDRIRMKREELGMSQDELAKRLGLKSRSSVTKVEKSDNLTLKQINLYAEALGCSPYYLLGWETEDGRDINEVYAEDNAHLISMIRNDKELSEALKVYFTLPKDKKEFIINTIQMLNQR